MMLRGDGMLGWWMMDVERHEGRWGWVVPAVLHEKEKAHKVSVFTLSLHLGVSFWWVCNSYAI